MRPHHIQEKGKWDTIITDPRLVKEICAGCLQPIPYNVDRYERQGNFCDRCDKRARQNVRIRKISEKALDVFFRHNNL